MRSQVSYTKPMLKRAKSEKKFLVTVAVNGKPVGDDSCCVQALVDLPKAKELADIAVSLLKRSY